MFRWAKPREAPGAAGRAPQPYPQPQPWLRATTGQRDPGGWKFLEAPAADQRQTSWWELLHSCFSGKETEAWGGDVPSEP